VNSLIAKKPTAFLVIVNASAIVAGLIVYLSGTPLKLALFTTVLTLALMNIVLFVFRGILAKKLPVTAPATAIRSTRRAWLWLVLGLFMIGNSLSQIAWPRLPSDKPLGYATLLASPALLYLAWKEFKKRRIPK
jgi:hypothetical protein